MSEEEGIQVPAPLRPTTSDPDAWKVYWKAQGQPWRTEPEIDVKRQVELARCRAIVPDIEKGIYPFKNMELSRADVEWLLSTHESGGICGPVDWSDKRQRTREGLDLRGAHLRGENLSGLPLARIDGQLTLNEWLGGPKEQGGMATVHLQEARLGEANLQEAHLWGANLQEVELVAANLQEAHLWGANLQEANLSRAQLKGADLGGVTLGNEKQVGPQLVDCQWSDVNLAVIEWTQVTTLGDEYQAKQKKDSKGEIKEKQTRLYEHKVAVRANRQLAVALQEQGLNEEAARFAYQAQVLQKSVLWYQMTQQGVPFKQRMQVSGGWLFSWVLFLLAGYGYRPRRSILWYLATIVVFAFGYHVFGHLSLWPPDAFVYSLTSFHGRGFFPGLEGKHSLHDPLIMFAAIEAVVGLVIEISFIATFTQRFFGK